MTQKHRVMIFFTRLKVTERKESLMSKFSFDTTKLKEQVEDQPLLAAGILVGLLTGASKLLNANTARSNAKTWKREVKRRERNSK